MTRQEQQENDKRYADWREVYADEVRDKVKHWGDRRKRGAAAPTQYGGRALDGAFAPGGDDV